MYIIFITNKLSILLKWISSQSIYAKQKKKRVSALAM